jgi:hypothetical protein
MIRQRLVGMPLEFLLAELMSPPGKHNYNISRYMVLDGELDIEALTKAIDTTFSEVDMVHCQYELDSEGAWQKRSTQGPCKVSRVDLRDAPDSMARCLETIRRDTNRVVPILSNEEKARAMLFLLGEYGGRSRSIYYHRFHHIQLDGYSGQELLVRRIAELYNAYTSRSEAPQADVGGYAALLEEEEEYIRSGQCGADKAFWKGYLTEYLKRTGDARVSDSELSPESLSYSVRIGSSAGHMPIESITGAILTALYQASGVACQMIGMTFMRRNKKELARIMSPMATVLPLWVDLRGSHEHGTVASQVGDAIRCIRKHQFYGGERAIRDLGRTGRRDALYLVTVNCRVFDRKPIVLNQLDTTSHIVSVGPVGGVTIVASMQNGSIQLSIESIYKTIHGLDIRSWIELLRDNLVEMLGGDDSEAERAQQAAGC